MAFLLLFLVCVRGEEVQRSIARDPSLPLEWVRGVKRIKELTTLSANSDAKFNDPPGAFQMDNYEYEIVEMIASSHASFIFKVRRLDEAARYVLKILVAEPSTVDRRCPSPIPALDRDNFFKECILLKYIGEIGIGPTTIGWGQTADISAVSSELNELNQGNGFNFLLMDRVGPSVGEYLKHSGASLVRDVLYIGFHSVGLLHRLHSNGIIHNDIHRGNIVFKSFEKNVADMDPKTDQLALIDMGQAEFFGYEEECTVALQLHDKSLVPEMLSPWQINGEPANRRDDLFRLGEMVLSYLASSPESFREFMKYDELKVREQRFLFGQQKDTSHDKSVLSSWAGGRSHLRT